jgi:hypothetical protein
VKRFSVSTFVVATAVHASGTALLLWENSRLIYYDTVNPPWFQTLCWIWIPFPMVFLRASPASFFAYRTFWFAAWSLCVGVFVGFVFRWCSAHFTRTV